MAEEQKQPQKEEKAKADDGSGQMLGISIIGKIVGVMVMTWLVSLSYYAFAFFALGMLPAIVAMFVDRGAGRFASKTVTAFNFIGVVPFLFDIAMSLNPSIVAWNAIRDVWAWLIIYSTAMVGWMVIWMVPQVTLFTFNLRAELKIKHLKKTQEELVEEWGDEITNPKALAGLRKRR